LSNDSAAVRVRGIAVVFLATLAAYWPVLRAGFIWDDDGHVTRPDLRSLHGLWRIWFEMGATQQYYPVLHSAFWVEHRLWGDSPLGYHLLNVLLHAASACVFGLILVRLGAVGPTGGRASGMGMTEPPKPDHPSSQGYAATSRSGLQRNPQPSRLAAWLGALLFALHPVCVESVAWISEQKNTLSTLLYLLSAFVYLCGREHPTRVWRRYLLATVLFVLAVLSKSVTATLPAALLVVLWWRQGTLSWKRDVVPLLPWFAIGLASGLTTAWVEKTYIGAQGAAFELGAVERCLLAGRVVWFYLGKLIWPSDLIFIYPHWTVSAAAAWQWLYPLAALALVAVLWAIRRRTRGPLAAVLYFVGTLFPALGFFNVYPFVFSYVADHFQYLASLGVIALAAGCAGAWPPFSEGGVPLRWGFGGQTPLVSRAAFAALLVAFGVLTHRQCAMYRSAETLYRTTLERNPDAWLAHDNLGVLLAREGRFSEAIGHYEEAFRINPGYPETCNNLGNALARLGRWPDAVGYYARALRLRPGFAEAELNWGNALADMGRLPDAVTHFDQALALRPAYAEARYGRANALANEGKLEQAIADYTEALRLRADYAEAHANLGLALATEGRFQEALPHLAQAIRIRPGYAEAHAYLGLALAGLGRRTEAVAAYREALRLNPADRDTHYHLGLVLRELGDAAGADAEFRASRPGNRGAP
jgi:tetratricopeptide (TPR) repeat protein